MNTTRSWTTFTDCWDLRNRGGFNQNGVYDIYPPPAHTRVRVRCDMTTDGGGWTVHQRRYNGSINFMRTFQEYEEGFGDISSEYWLGLVWMHTLTTKAEYPVQMRVDLCTFNGTVGYAIYDVFSISSKNDTYRLNVGRFTDGIILDRLTAWHSGHIFQTTGVCAKAYIGGWRYRSCISANLNGGRYNGGHQQGIVWWYFGRDSSTMPSLRSSEIKIRPVNATWDAPRPCT